MADREVSQEQTLAFGALLAGAERLLGELFGEQAIEIVDGDHSECPDDHVHTYEVVPKAGPHTLRILLTIGHLVYLIRREGLPEPDPDALREFWEELFASMDSHTTETLQVAAKAAKDAADNESLLRLISDVTNEN